MGGANLACDRGAGRQADEVSRAGAAARSRSRGRDSEWLQPVFVRADRDRAAAASGAAADAAVGL